MRVPVCMCNLRLCVHARQAYCLSEPSNLIKADGDVAPTPSAGGAEDAAPEGAAEASPPVSVHLVIRSWRLRPSPAARLAFPSAHYLRGLRIACDVRIAWCVCVCVCVCVVCMHTHTHMHTYYGSEL